MMKNAASGESPSAQIDKHIAGLGDWRGKTLAKMRALIKAADPDVVEEVKWGGVPTWYHDGIICTGETYKAAVKLTFAHGAELADPKKIFNSSLEGNMRRAIDIHEHDKIDEAGFKKLFAQAVARNAAHVQKTAKKPASKKPAKK